MDQLADILPHVNASLNALTTTLLLLGMAQIKRGRELAHQRLMLSAFGVSMVFLVCYLVRRWLTGEVRFPSYPPDAVRYGYLAMLLTHVLLATTVPPLAGVTIYLAYRGRRAAHRRVARITFPIWLYVSITGVLVYLMLYQIFPPRPDPPTMAEESTVVCADYQEPSAVGAWF